MLLEGRAKTSANCAPPQVIYLPSVGTDNRKLSFTLRDKVNSGGRAAGKRCLSRVRSHNQ
jgi:hypothetical protein